MKCNDCCYFYSDIDEKSGELISESYCHYFHIDGYAPCEIEDLERETIDE